MSAPRLIRKYRLADPKPRAAAFVAALFLLLSPAHAVPVTVGPVVISVPEGFELAQTQRLKKTYHGLDEVNSQRGYEDAAAD